jgi:hypothetical protein
MTEKFKYRLAKHLCDLLHVEATEKMGPLEELHGAEIHLVSSLLLQVWLPSDGGPRRIVEIKVSEPVT